MNGLPKPLRWRGTSKRDYESFPPEVQREMGYALYLVQMGERHQAPTKILKGFAGASVVEIRENAAGGTYRAVYTVRFADTVYVLHAFQKKSTKGIATSDRDMHLIEQRLKALIAERA